MSPPAAALRARVRRLTREARPLLCPELRLRLATPDCALWRATAADLQTLGLADPFWAFCWPGGQALARFLLDTPAEVAGRRVLASAPAAASRPSPPPAPGRPGCGRSTPIRWPGRPAR